MMNEGFPNILAFSCFKFSCCYFTVKLHIVAHTDRSPWKTNLCLYKLEYAKTENLYQSYRGRLRKFYVNRLAVTFMFINN